jgi:phenylalanyl-tRNA synthetase alpha chain
VLLRALVEPALSDLASLKSELIAAIDSAADMAALEAARVGALGKKGRLTDLMKGLGALDGEARKAQGQALNQLRAAIEDALAAKKAALEAAALDVKLAAERIDVTLPPRPLPQGRIHPLSQCMEEVAAIFGEMGFTVVEGPDIESDWHNFTALNIPPEHPARQMHDTFYLAEGGNGANAAPQEAHLHQGAMVAESPERAIRLHALNSIETRRADYHVALPTDSTTPTRPTHRIPAPPASPS